MCDSSPFGFGPVFTAKTHFPPPPPPLFVYPLVALLDGSCHCQLGLLSLLPWLFAISTILRVHSFIVRTWYVRNPVAVIYSIGNIVIYVFLYNTILAQMFGMSRALVVYLEFPCSCSLSIFSVGSRSVWSPCSVLSFVTTLCSGVGINGSPSPISYVMFSDGKIFAQEIILLIVPFRRCFLRSNKVGKRGFPCHNPQKNSLFTSRV